MLASSKHSNMFNRTIHVLCLSTAIVSSLGAPVRAQGIVADGNVVTVPTGTTINTGTDEDSPGLHAHNSGTINGDDVTVITAGKESAGALAEQDSKIELKNSDIKTSGDHAYGIHTNFNGSAIIGASNISTTGEYGVGVYTVGDGSSTTLTDTEVQTEGKYAHGAHAYKGADLSITSGKVTTKGDDSHGILVDSEGATGTAATVTGAEIRTEGERAVGAWALKGGSISLNGGSITTTGDNSEGVRGSDSGSIVNIEKTKINTGGKNAIGAATNNGAHLKVSDASVNTTGEQAIGINAYDAGSIAEVSNTNIITEGKSAYGATALKGGALSTTNTDITTQGDNAVGAQAVDGGKLSITGGSVTTKGGSSWGVHASGAGSTITITDATITTEGARAGTDGAGAHGAVAENGGNLSISGGSITTKEKYARGVDIRDGGSATIDGTTITSQNAAISASGSGTTVDVNNATLIAGSDPGTVRAAGAGAHADNGAKVTVTGSTITSENRGVNAAGEGATLTVTDTTINSERGAQASDGANLSINNSSITATETGVWVHNKSTATLTDVDIKSKNDGIYVSSGGTVNLQRGSGNGTRIQVSGENAGIQPTNGIYTTNSTVTAEGATILVEGKGAGILAVRSTVNLAQTYVKSAAGPALNGYYQSNFNLTDGTLVESDSGILFNAAVGSMATISADGNVALIGDMVVDQAAAGSTAASGTLQADLKNGSSWKGAGSGVTGASIDGTSNWLMTGSSDIGTLTNNGTIAFDATNPYKTLTAGSLNMDGGSFLLNTELNEGGAASKTDRLVVTGDATGDGVIKIRNNGGTGAHTGTGATDGIQIVQIGGASDAEFKLGSAAIVGIYDYQLKKADGQNWYLQTEGKDDVNPPVDPVDPKPPVDPVDPKPPVDPVDPGTPVDPVVPVDPVTPVKPGTGHVVDIVPGYNIALSAAQNHVLTSLDTFHERLGELRAEDLNDGYHAWMRGIGKTGSYSPNSVTGYNGHGFDMTTAGVQIGADYSKSNVFIAGDKFTVGMFGEYANSNFDVRGRTAHGSISSKGLGGYVTWQQKAPTDKKPGTGAYVDAVVKQDWLNFGVSAKSVSGFDLQKGYKGKATTASIETGYGFDLGNNVVLQPSAQLTWSKVKADSFTDPYGIAVHGQEAESLIGRIGMRLEKTFYFGDEAETVDAAPQPQKQLTVKGKNGKAVKAAPAALPEAPKKKKFVKSVTTYADANVKHEFKGKNGLVASNNGIGNDMGGTRYDVGVGVVARVSENVSLFGRGSVEFGGSTNVAGKVSGGLKISW